MKFSNEIEVFINDYVKDLNAGTASVFAGAGLSIPAGFVNWSELMNEMRTCEYDLDQKNGIHTRSLCSLQTPGFLLCRFCH